jgi:catechol 2,3-dioxygenase-like lactoylglutathione lyase family enzyme
VSADIEALVGKYDAGQITRRDFVGTLCAMVTAQQPAKSTLDVRSLNHVTLFVSDVQRSVAFYQDLLGLPVMSKQDNGINLAAGSSFVGIYPAAAAAKPHINHFCLGVESFDADRALKACADRGVKGRVRMRGDVKEFYFPDPDNLSVQLQDVSYRG